MLSSRSAHYRGEVIFARAAGSALVGACLLSAAPAEATTRTSGPAAAPEEDRRAAAKAAFRAGREAASAGDYETALEGFERARALEPSPGLHYNIAVCHHRLMLRADEGSETHDARRLAAIDAYNLYLASSPDAEDRETVEDLVVSLGGHPVTRKRWTIERLDPDPALPSPALREAEEEPIAEEPASIETPPNPPADAPPKPWRPRARVGPGFVVMLSNMRQLSKQSEVATLPMIGLSLRGGAFVGPQRRINVGGELAVVGQPTGSDARHRLGAGHFGATVDYGHPLGKQRRFEIGVGSLVALTGQTLHHRGTSSVSCPAGSESDTDRQISQRGGLLLGGRLTLALLLGKRRNHELALRITPGLGLYGRGSKTDGERCNDLPTPFEELGMGRPALVTTVDLGYAPRF